MARRFAPKLRRYLPPGRELVIDDYLGEFRVVTDMTYPIERDMLVSWYEPDAVAIVDSFVGEGSICLDVGANVGALTIAMARRVGPRGKVYAFEPGLVTHARLARNLNLNPSIRDRVIALRLGVSDRQGTLYWSEQVDNRGNATLRENSGEPVPVVSVDEHFSATPLPRLDFVKIDVEGMEWEVLLGAQRTVATHRPVIYFETLEDSYSGRGLSVRQRLEELLVGRMKYALYRLKGDGRLAPVTAATMSAYTLAIHETHRDRIQDGMLPGITREAVERLREFGMED